MVALIQGHWDETEAPAKLDQIQSKILGKNGVCCQGNPQGT